MQKKAIKRYQHQLCQRYQQGECVNQLISEWTAFIDDWLRQQWQQHFSEHEALCLIALGGYGRQEYFLHSDIDVFILLPEETDTLLRQIEKFIQSLWHQHHDICHSVRTLDQCIEAAAKDITIFTNLLDARLLAGDSLRFQHFYSLISAGKLWSTQAFYHAKVQEQKQRHQKYGSSNQRLEPNIKNSPGGLRDIHTVTWLMQRKLGTNALNALVDHHLLSPKEYQKLKQAQQLLYRIRFALHCISGQCEDRLLFDYQYQIAKMLGYPGKNKTKVIEHFMKDYYRAAEVITASNDMLLQWLAELMLPRSKQAVIRINKNFQVRQGYLEATNQNVFQQFPAMLLEMFSLLQNVENIVGVHANTIRLIHQHVTLIDHDFRQDKKHCQQFLKILSQPRRLSAQIQRMNRYGILSRYIPEFEPIMGLMQYDLFHIYAVDEHIIRVIANIEFFYQADAKQDFPLCHQLSSKIEKPELLHIAALFHDIGKGRDSNHSALGASFVKAFCHQHGLSDSDTDMVVWLVEQHLLMSVTAQQQDIYDPETIENFTRKIKRQRYLDNLYLLTVADINATNPKLWNSWKDTLLKELYRLSSGLLEQHASTINRKQIIEQRQNAVLILLAEHHIPEKTVWQLWNRFSSDYFLQQSASNIFYHSKTLLEKEPADQPLVFTRQHHTQGATQFFIYMPYHQNSFAMITTVLANEHLSILEAQINYTNDGYSLDTYIVLDENGHPVADSRRLTAVAQQLQTALSTPHQVPKLTDRWVERKQRHFTINTKVHFVNKADQHTTTTYLTSADRPGLLANFSKILVTCGIDVHSAKINTAGERVEDVFHLSVGNQALTPEKQALLAEKLHSLTRDSI